MKHLTHLFVRAFLPIFAITLLITAAAWGEDGSSAPLQNNTLTEQEQAEGFELIFNGQNLDGWRGDVAGYAVENGEIRCKPGGNVFFPKDYANFVLRFEFNLPPAGNNGLAVRREVCQKPSRFGFELQILDDYADCYKDLKPYQYCTSVYGYVPAKRGALKPAGEWNCKEVIANGPHLIVKLNGQTTIDTDLSALPEPQDEAKRPGVHNPAGALGFLGHGDQVRFRNIRIKVLEDQPK